MIKIGVIGVGYMGRNHVQNILELPNRFELVGCHDKSKENAAIVRETFGVDCFGDVDSLIDRTDAVVLAIPSSLHLEYGMRLAHHRRHALIEKPIALDEADGRLLCEAFGKAGKTLMVGHVERYNPAVVEMKKILDEENGIIAIDARRFGPHEKRIDDTSVVFDLMVHDLDIVLNCLQPSGVASMDAKAIVVDGEDHSDYVQSVIQHETGAISTICASRVTESKIRTIDVHTGTSLIQADLLHKTLQVIRKTNIALDVVGYTPRYRQESVVERIILPNVEPLKAELIEFADAIKENRKALTCGESAARALHYAGQIHNLTKNGPRLSGQGGEA